MKKLLEDMEEAFDYVAPICGKEMAGRIRRYIRTIERERDVFKTRSDVSGEQATVWNEENKVLKREHAAMREELHGIASRTNDSGLHDEICEVLSCVTIK